MARQAARSTTFSAASVSARGSTSRPPSRAVTFRLAASATPSAAAAWKAPEFSVRSMYSTASPAAKPPRIADEYMERTLNSGAFHAAAALGVAEAANLNVTARLGGARSTRGRRSRVDLAPTEPCALVVARPCPPLVQLRVLARLRARQTDHWPRQRPRHGVSGLRAVSLDERAQEHGFRSTGNGGCHAARSTTLPVNFSSWSVSSGLPTAFRASYQAA